jgi:hypothetical protein
LSLLERETALKTPRRRNTFVILMNLKAEMRNTSTALIQHDQDLQLPSRKFSATSDKNPKYAEYTEY